MKRKSATHSSHELLLTAPGYGDTASTLAFPKDRVLRSSQGGLRGILVNHFSERVAHSLALAVQEDMYALNGMLKPRGDSRWSNVLFK